MKLYSKLLLTGVLLSSLSIVASQTPVGVARALGKGRRGSGDGSYVQVDTSCNSRFPALEFDELKVAMMDPDRTRVRDMQDAYQIGLDAIIKDMLDPIKKSVAHDGSSRDCFRILLTAQCLREFDIYFQGESDVQV